MDALMQRPTLVRLQNGATSVGRVTSLARRHLLWALSEWQRARLTPEGELRPGPRNAGSLDAPVGESCTDLYDLVGSEKSEPSLVLERRENLKGVLRMVAEESDQTRSVLVGYMRGDDKQEIAKATGLRANAIDARKSRFVRKHRS